MEESSDFCQGKLSDSFSNLQFAITAADQSSDSKHRKVPASILTAQSLVVIVFDVIAGIHIHSLASESNYMHQLKNGPVVTWTFH